MKLPCIIIAVSALLVSSSCNNDESKPKRPDLRTPATKDGGEAAKAAKIAEAVEARSNGRVFFVKPADGATVPEQFEVEFGIEGKIVRPAGATERNPAFGHHHVLIDDGPIDNMAVVPKDETHLHFGAGETKTTLKLTPGKHQLTMQFADGAHRSYGPKWAATITVEVDGGAAAGGAAAGGAAADGAAADGAAADGAAAGGEAKAGG